MTATERGEGGSENVEPPFPSTTWAWRRVRIARPPEARKISGPKGLHAWRGLSPWPIRRKPVTVTFKYRGGAECWYEIHARGRTSRLTGGLMLHDLLRAIAGE